MFRECSFTPNRDYFKFDAYGKFSSLCLGNVLSQERADEAKWFENDVIVFVPMFRECSFTLLENLLHTQVLMRLVFVPMFRECSFTLLIILNP